HQKKIIFGFCLIFFDIFGGFFGYFLMFSFILILSFIFIHFQSILIIFEMNSQKGHHICKSYHARTPKKILFFFFFYFFLFFFFFFFIFFYFFYSFYSTFIHFHSFSIHFNHF